MFLWICASGQFLRYYCKIGNDLQQSGIQTDGVNSWNIQTKTKLNEYSYNMGVQSFFLCIIVHESNDCLKYRLYIMTFLKPSFKIHFTIFTCMYACDMLVEYKWSRINVSFGWVFDDYIGVVEVLHSVGKIDIRLDQVNIKCLSSGYWQGQIQLMCCVFYR